MHPVLLRIGPLTVHTYGVLVAAGFLLGLALAVKQAEKEGIPRERIIDIGFYVLLSAIVGSRLFFVAINGGYYLRNPLGIFRIWEGGLVFYGGLALAVPVALWYMRKHRLDFRSIADVFTPSLALGHAIGRLGCFSAGCCYGRPAHVSWAVTFLDPECLARTGVPLHPTQLYESLGEFVNFLILVSLRKHQSFKGQLFWSYLFLYSALRFADEFFRGDEARGYLVSGISVSQGISLVVGLVALAVIAKKLLGVQKGQTTGEF
ncbi:MAG: prolipoprotein diacylglyceryl transferase [Nitrospirae bacterium]|nr:prolipoprotein diacylglyceryl transferase [Nitrospirota bacterium]